VPLKEFEFTLYGGMHGYLVLSRNICGATAVADAKFTSQEGQSHKEKVPLTANCP
jgi:hypothetical protein